jgi:hypothetical protein
MNLNTKQYLVGKFHYKFNILVTIDTGKSIP